ncbi:putative fasciclin-like arabinogalactan protein 20 [Durio zibethinus]|uniref:Fasciclin-like arabinogalactan protein 20 n=1 Tax=Durio zibethinus TaxID=66656 RepID=A0A6P6BF10_DURZI|nr:putative fasciclin-like arabinogalactan protein 20 [Durio zibethinus]
MASRFLLLLILSYLLPLSSALPSQTLLDAVEILSDSGFVSMALTLGLLSKTLLLQSPSLTIFSPTDHVFVEHGQPPLSLLQFHLSPLPLSLQSLETLPPASTIPTLLPNHSLVITSSSSDDYVSLNGVRIDGSPIFDDGSLIVFGIQEFFDPNFGVPRPNPTCVPSVNGDDHSFAKASLVLRSSGYSVMASFLDLQLLGFKATTATLTVFAPIDDAMKTKGYIGNFSEYPSIFFRHVLPCKFSWADLVAFNDGALLGTYLEGFKINVTKSGNNMMINEVAITTPDLYYGGSIVVHGLQEVLAVLEKPQRLAESPSDNELDHCEF